MGSDNPAFKGVYVLDIGAGLQYGPLTLQEV